MCCRDRLLEALAVGMCTQTAVRGRSTGVYHTVHQNTQALMAVLVGRGYEWIVYSELHSTGRPYLAVVSVVRPEWLVVRLSSQMP